jgi:hypothetical protein
MPSTTTGTPITVQVQHDQVNTSSYDLVINGTVSASKPVDPAGVNFQFPTGMAQGTYDLVVRAVGPGGTTASDMVQLVVLPAAPSQPTIVIVVG